MASISMDWAKVSILSVVVFLIGWYFLGLLWAVILAIVVLLLTGTLKVKS